jgi:NADH-ubiquinone oxidoreductase chain 1
VFTIVSVVMMIPFLTLWERKILRYIQVRKGPKKVGFLGIIQPVTDGLKLVLKESGSISSSNLYFFWFRPLLKFFFMLILYLIFSYIFPSFTLNLGLILYLCFSSLLVYRVLLSG